MKAPPLAPIVVALASLAVCGCNTTHRTLREPMAIVSLRGGTLKLHLQNGHVVAFDRWRVDSADSLVAPFTTA